jgi:hypothetical protein
MLGSTTLHPPNKIYKIPIIRFQLTANIQYLD